jgi:RNA polymerase sigma-70 factor (ECF subfamily)
MKAKEMYSDPDVVQKILNGEIALFEVIIRRYNPFLYRVGRSYHYNHEDTQDLMQETFIDAYNNLAGFENRASFKTWIIKIMLHNCYKKQQKFSYKNEFAGEVADESVPMFSNDHSDTNKKIMNRELSQVIEKAIEQIPEDYSIVFSLREMNGLSVKETAEALSISESNVKVRLNRAKAMLRKEVEKKYTAEDIFEFNLVYCDAMVENVMGVILEKHNA